jgi:hypothetical protein
MFVSRDDQRFLWLKMQPIRDRVVDVAGCFRTSKPETRMLLAERSLVLSAAIGTLLRKAQDV